MAGCCLCLQRQTPPACTTNRSDIFIHDITTSTTTRVNLPGRTGGATYVAVRDPRFSSDGGYVAFVADRRSSWRWLFGVGTGRDVLIHDRTTGTTRLVNAGGVADLPSLMLTAGTCLSTGRRRAYSRSTLGWGRR